MLHPIDTIKTMTPAYASKLSSAGITTTGALLERCASLQGRKAVAAKTGISKDLLLKWVNNADLMRLRGVETESSQLLEAAGVCTISELKDRVPEKLHAQLSETNAAKRLTRLTPALQDVQAWIVSARTTQPRVSA